MSDEETINTPDPTFLKQDSVNLRTPLGLSTDHHQQKSPEDVKAPRLSRRELEALLDNYYAISDDDLFDEPETRNHAQIAGNRMVRNLALACSIALFFGFGLSLYGLSQQGGDTRIGHAFNSSIAGLVAMVRPAVSGEENSTATLAKTHVGKTSIASGKPVKTASLIVADASGTILAGIPLKLSLNSDAHNSLLQVKIMNVPADAVLTAGTKNKDGVWILQPSDLSNVSLVVSADRKTPLSLEIELVEAKTGELLSPTREIKVAILGPERFKVRGL